MRFNLFSSLRFTNIIGSYIIHLLEPTNIETLFVMSVITQNILGMTHLCISQENNICELHRVVQARLRIIFFIYKSKL